MSNKNEKYKNKPIKRKRDEKFTKAKKLKLQFPKEIHLTLFEFLEPKDLFNVFLVNKNFYKIANQEYLW